VDIVWQNRKFDVLLIRAGYLEPETTRLDLRILGETVEKGHILVPFCLPFLTYSYWCLPCRR
jgi:hypothetical protein